MAKAAGILPAGRNPSAPEGSVKPAPPPNPPKAQEIEALRAEVERLTLEMSCLQQQYDERTAYVIVHRGSALSCSDAMRTAYSDERRRADKLAEALRGWWKTRRPVGWTEDQHRSCPHVNLATDAEKALATALLRDQEEGNG